MELLLGMQQVAVWRLNGMPEVERGVGRGGAFEGGAGQFDVFGVEITTDERAAGGNLFEQKRGMPPKAEGAVGEDLVRLRAE